MKHILPLLFSFLFFSCTVKAQDFWEQLPFPDTLDISCVAVNDQGHIFAGTVTEGPCVSEGVYRSTDSGQTWQYVLNTSTFQINAIGINSLGNIFVSSNGFNTLWKSTNNGNTWQLLNNPNNYHISQFYCLGGDTLLIGCDAPGIILLLKSVDGCLTFDTLCLDVSATPGERVTDIDVAPNGDIYFSRMCFFPNSGGVYKSTDNGTTWHEIGMLNHQVQAVEINNQGDVFIGVFYDFLQGAGGLYALYHDSTTIDTCLYGPQVNGIAINSAGDIYAGIGWPDGVIVSKNNGLTFEFENSGLIVAEMGDLSADTNDYIYALYNGATPYLYRSSEPTVTALPDFHSYSGIKNILLYPNPAKDILNGILLKNNTIQGMQNCCVYSSEGKLVANKSIDVTSNCFNLNIAGLKSGVYIVIIGNYRNYFKTSFVKQ